MVNRKEEQGDEAIKKIKKEAGDNANIEWIPCDMEDLKQTKETFTKIRSEEKRLDLVRNTNRSYCVSSVNHKLYTAGSICWYQRKSVRRDERRDRPPFPSKLAGPILRLQSSVSNAAQNVQVT